MASSDFTKLNVQTALVPFNKVSDFPVKTRRVCDIMENGFSLPPNLHGESVTERATKKGSLPGLQHVYSDAINTNRHTALHTQTSLSPVLLRPMRSSLLSKSQPEASLRLTTFLWPDYTARFAPEVLRILTKWRLGESFFQEGTTFPSYSPSFSTTGNPALRLLDPIDFHAATCSKRLRSTRRHKCC